MWYDEQGDVKVNKDKYECIQRKHGERQEHALWPVHFSLYSENIA